MICSSFIVVISYNVLFCSDHQTCIQMAAVQIIRDCVKKIYSWRALDSRVGKSREAERAAAPSPRSSCNEDLFIWFDFQLQPSLFGFRCFSYSDLTIPTYCQIVTSHWTTLGIGVTHSTSLNLANRNGSCLWPWALSLMGHSTWAARRSQQRLQVVARSWGCASRLLCPAMEASIKF